MVRTDKQTETQINKKFDREQKHVKADEPDSCQSAFLLNVRTFTHKVQWNVSRINT